MSKAPSCPGGGSVSFGKETEPKESRRALRAWRRAGPERRRSLSETFDDYSYTAGEGTFEDMVKALNLAALLDEFVVQQASGNMTFRMRRL